jgi:4-aminobutyrate aminotransferase-like enzyme
MNLKQLDRRFVAREEAEDLEVVRAEGSFIFDARGKKYIDFLSGWCVGNFGWGNERVRRVIARSKAPDYVYPYYLYRPWVELAQLLAEITPGKLRKCYRATGGSEAVDIALQLAMIATGRKKFLAIEGSYHGNSIATIRVAQSSGRKVKPPLDERAAARVETILQKRDVAAFIMEPISCNLGVLIPEREFITRVSALCRRYGTLFIADEVACGFGRTGALFASEHFDLEPDILCMAKAITGGAAPMGATIVTPDVADAVDGEGGFYSTYGWHPLSVDVAIDNIRWIVKNQRRLLRGVSEMSDYIRDRLSGMKFKPPAKLRIKGMAIGVETGDEDYVDKITKRCRKNGLLLTSSDNILTMFPPLTLERETADDALDILERSLKSR